MSSGASVGDGGVAGEDGFQHDGPVEDEETAREKMEEAGFDPDDVTKECELSDHALETINIVRTLRMRPMAYFCGIGDLKMCRYLLSKGASTTATSTCGWWFPMYSAALGGHLDACKWLYDHGAEGDIIKTNGRNGDIYSHFSPLGCAVGQWSVDRKNTSRWFILKGVLSPDDKPGVVCPILMRRDIHPRRHDDEIEHHDDEEASDDVIYDERPRLLEWAKQSVQTHSSFMTFIMGTLPAPAFTQDALQSLLAERLQSQDAAETLMKIAPENQYECLWSKIIRARTTPVLRLGGKIGILVLIADYVGVVRGRDLRILRSLVGPLSKYLEEEPPEGELDSGSSHDDEEEEDNDEETHEEEEDEE